MVEYVGLDVSKEETAYCVMDEEGKVLTQSKVASDPDGMFEVILCRPDDLSHCRTFFAVLWQTPQRRRTVHEMRIEAGRVSIMERCTMEEPR